MKTLQHSLFRECLNITIMRTIVLLKDDKRMIFTFILLLFGVFHTHSSEIIRIPSFDGEIVEGKLNIPTTNFTNKIVIDVPGSGPFTFETRRKLGRGNEFCFHHYFSDEFARRGVAYFSYSTRYTTTDSLPPFYDKVDKEKFFTYTPSIKVKDLEAVIKFLRSDKRLAKCQFILLGWSEGSVIASLVAERKNVSIDALFMAGAPSDDIYTTILWQHSGASSMINMRKFFDENKDSIIQRSEYNNGNPKLIARFGNQKFEHLDVNSDTILTTDDFCALVKPRLMAITKAIEKNDNEWIWNSFFRVGVSWIIEHRNIEPNKTRVLKLGLPVYLFHGTNDANAPVEGILQLQKVVRILNKSNIHFYIFPDNDHSLEFMSWVVNQAIPPSINTLIDQVEKL